MITISTITPVYAGDAYLARLVEELAALRATLAAATDEVMLAEAIFVDDGAIDESARCLEELRAKHEWIKVLRLSRNFGQHNATAAGILHSSGDWVVTLDEDLQHPPHMIVPMLKAAAEKRFDVVLGQAIRGSHGGSYRDILSRLAKKLIGALAGDRLVPFFSSFRVIRGSIARAAAKVCSHQTYFDVAVSWFTTRVCSLPMDLSDRRFTEEKSSSYSLMKLLSHAKRLLTSSDLHLFRISVLVSGFSFALTLLLGLWVLLSYFLSPEVAAARGWASLMGAILLYGGIISLMLGFVLEVVKINLFQGQGKPIFFTVDRASDDRLLAELEKLPR